MTAVPERVHWMVDLLDLRPSDHVLEIGCGAGQAVALVCERHTRGTITAIDRSPIMVRRARERNRACIESGRARVEQRALADASFDTQFRKVFAINVNAFWTAPAPSLAALKRLLHPQGTAYLAYEPPSAGRLRQLRERLPTQLEENGFNVRDVREQRFSKASGICIIGTLR
ncbi:MAG TPA: class I SAM-dependent methyltransferase [Gemmatimonadaceae bacterium]|nr:class I SAM-dependent methyltransferase [Gemmatimonadaceae bacterium]